MMRRPGLETAGVVALALMVSVPFLNPVHLSPLPTFYEEAVALGLGLLAIVSLGLARSDGRSVIPAISVWIAALGLLFMMQPHWTSAAYREPAQVAGLYALWAAALMWAGARIGSSGAERACTVLAGAILAAAVLGALAAWLQYLGLASWVGLFPSPHGARISGLLAQPNLHANYLVVGVLSATYLGSSKRLPVALAAACCLVLVGAIALSGSRAALLELGALVMLAGWVGGKRFLVPVAVVFVLVALCGTLYQFATAEASTPAPEAGGLRLPIYEAAVRTWLSAPVAGVGIGGFTWAHYTTPTPWAGDVPMRPEPNAHNIVLQLLAETGLVGAALFLAALIVWAIPVLRRRSFEGEGWRVWAVGVVCVELAHSLVEFPLWHAHFLGLAALAAGLAERRIYEMKSAVLGRALILGAAATGCLLLFSTVRERGLLNDGSGLAEAQNLRRSLLMPYVDAQFAARLPVSRENLEEKIALNGRVMHFLPGAPVVQKQILLMAVARRSDEAISLVRDMARLQPDAVSELQGVLSRFPVALVPVDSPVRDEVGRRALAAPRPGEP